MDEQLDALISFGDAVKATKLDDGSVKLAGYLVRFGSPDETDLVGDFFTPHTDFGNAEKSDGWFNHRMPVKFDKKSITYSKQLPDVKLIKDDVGVFAEMIIGARNEYEKDIIAAGLAGKLGWSSGTAPHLVERKKVSDNASEITLWKLGLDASLTPTPAEPRNTVMQLKSLITSEDAVQPDGEKKDITQETNIMNKDEIVSVAEEAVKGAVKDIAEATAEQTVKAFDQQVNKRLEEFKAAMPEVKAGYHIEVVEDEADKELKENPFKTGEFFLAVKSAAEYGQIDKRLLPLKATGLNEAIPSQGGFLLPPKIAEGVFERMYGVGSLLSQVQRDPVDGNTMLINAVDETSRANGSRHGGVTTYWLEEAGAITASRPTFRQISLKLKKVGALVYATDELLEDQSFLQSFLSRIVPDELRFATEDAIYNGDGIGKPLGVMNSPARVDVTRTNANTVIYADVINMWARRWAGANDYIWLVNQDVMPQLDQLIHNGTGSIPPRFVDYDAEGTMRLKGRPVIETEYAKSLGTNGDIVLFSPSSYQLIDKSSGVQSAASIHVAFTTGEQVFRFLYRVDGAPLWNSALTPFNGTNTQSPMVGLSTSS